MYKSYVWGGKKLNNIYGLSNDYDIIAESWVLSAHSAGQNIIDSGRYKGMTFGTYLRMVGKEVLGHKCRLMSRFPLLIKFIDAKENLSVQVHPDDKYALENEQELGKNEMWYIIDCEPGSSVYVGFNKNVNRDEVERRVNNNTILEILNKIVTYPGKIYLIPAGIVHAIGGGNFICEIQQNSDCTYRLYDYGRRDKTGSLRELHLNKALNVINYSKYNYYKQDCQYLEEKVITCRWDYFGVKIYKIERNATVNMDTNSFASIVCVEGKIMFEIAEKSGWLEEGKSLFIFAQQGVVNVYGIATIIVCQI